MTCEEAREQIGGDPDTASPELLAHLSECAQCRQYRERMLALNAKIRRALELNLQPSQQATPPAAPYLAASQPERSNVRTLPRRPEAVARKRAWSRGLGAVAGLAAALVAAFALWISKPTASLASEIVTHVEGEPTSWSRTQPVSVEALDAVLRKSGVRLGPGIQPVVYASSCWFRGHFVPHFVTMTADGPVTVMILSSEHVAAEQHFSEDGFSGLLVPAGAGSVAVLSRKPMPLDKSATDVVHALQSAQGSTSTAFPSRL